MLSQRSLKRVVIARPAGNDTALVFDQVDREEQGYISKQIQQNYPDVEQVMFVEQTTAGCYGRMAGGEFCGNATRSLAAVLARDGFIPAGQDIELNVSGSAQPLRVRAQNGEAMAQMPVNPQAVTIQTADPGITLVELEGISFVVVEQPAIAFAAIRQIKTLDERKSYAFSLIRKYGFADKVASGVLMLEENNSRLMMDPYVYVRDTQTLYFETACGSGSTAIGLIMAQRQNQSLTDFAIYQPSGMPIKVSVDYTNSVFNSASINGPVTIEYDGAMSFYLDNMVLQKAIA